MFDLNALWAQLSAIHPLAAVSVAIVLYVLRDKGYLRFPGTAAAIEAEKAKAAKIATEKADTERPLRDRLKCKVADRFDKLVESGVDPDDAYKFLLNQSRGSVADVVPTGKLIQ